jgi:hypothetical protein
MACRVMFLSISDMSYPCVGCLVTCRSGLRKQGRQQWRAVFLVVLLKYSHNSGVKIQGMALLVVFDNGLVEYIVFEGNMP